MGRCVCVCARVCVCMRAYSVVKNIRNLVTIRPTRSQELAVIKREQVEMYHFWTYTSERWPLYTNQFNHRDNSLTAGSCRLSSCSVWLHCCHCLCACLLLFSVFFLFFFSPHRVGVNSEVSHGQLGQSPQKLQLMVKKENVIMKSQL